MTLDYEVSREESRTFPTGSQILFWMGFPGDHVKVTEKLSRSNRDFYLNGEF